MSERELDEASLCEEFVAVHSQPFFLNLKALSKGQKANFMKEQGANSRNDGRRQRERRYQLKLFGRRVQF